MNASEYRRAFVFPGFTDDGARPTLVHPGLPGPDRIVLWYALPPGAAACARVEVELDGGRGGIPASHVVHQPLGARGRVIVHRLPPGQTFRAVLVIDGERCPPVLTATAPAPTQRARFSFLAYSCFAPFPEHGRALPARTVHILKLLERRSGAVPSAALTLPSFALAMGDQVYVDKGALWGRNPRAMLLGHRAQRTRYSGETDSRAKDFFQILYEAHLRLRPYERALRALPHAMMWDDHDIRDGWGSHGDEHDDRWRAHLDAAREAFLSYQFLRNPEPVAFPGLGLARGDDFSALIERIVSAREPPTCRPELHFSFDWGSATRFFVMDLRSRRTSGPGQHVVITSEQLQALERWLGGAATREPHEPRLYVLVSSLPLCHAPGSRFSAMWGPWFRADDRRDSWWSAEGRGDRDQVLRVIREHFSVHRRDRLLVLSGDVHFGDILSLWIEDSGKRRIFGHEVVASGLAQTGFQSRFRDRSQGDLALAHGIGASGAGARLFVPHFSELFVGPGSAESAPSVAVAFYPAARSEGGRLVNPGAAIDTLASAPSSAAQGRLALEVGHVPPAALPSFERFMIDGPGAPRWDDPASGWDTNGAWG